MLDKKSTNIDIKKWWWSGDEFFFENLKIKNKTY